MSDPEFVPTHKFPTVKRPLKRQNGGTMEINQVNNSYYAGGVQGTAGTASAGQTTDEYLRGLEQKYGVHITVGNDSGFEDYMWGAGKGGNVYIPRNIAEKMASDEAYAAKYEKLISEEPENSRHMQEYCDNHNTILYGTGMQIHEDGSVTWWAIGGDKEPRENPGTVYREKVQKQLKEKRAQKKKEEAREAKALRKKEDAERLAEGRAKKAEEAEKVREKFFVEAESVTELQRKTGNASAGEALADAVARGQGLGGQMDISV